MRLLCVTLVSALLRSCRHATTGTKTSSDWCTDKGLDSCVADHSWCQAHGFGRARSSPSLPKGQVTFDQFKAALCEHVFCTSLAYRYYPLPKGANWTRQNVQSHEQCQLTCHGDCKWFLWIQNPSGSYTFEVQHQTQWKDFESKKNNFGMANTPSREFPADISQHLGCWHYNLDKNPFHFSHSSHRHPIHVNTFLVSDRPDEAHFRAGQAIDGRNCTATVDKSRVCSRKVHFGTFEVSVTEKSSSDATPGSLIECAKNCDLDPKCKTSIWNDTKKKCFTDRTVTVTWTNKKANRQRFITNVDMDHCVDADSQFGDQVNAA